MQHGMKPEYPRAPVPPARYAAASSAATPFTRPFNTPGFPQHFPGLVSYPRPLPSAGYQGVSTEPSYQLPAGWTLQQDELQNLEVKKKAEEFLRMLETDDWLKPAGESGDKGMRRPSADGEPQRHASRGRSRSKSRSRARSQARSRGRSRAKSRARSRGRSRAWSRSRSRGKSHTRAKSRPRTRSRSRGRSLARSKSQPRLSKDSQRGIIDPTVSSGSSRVPDLFQNLKQVLQSKEPEKHLSVEKDTFMISQQETAVPPTRSEFRMKPYDPGNAVLPHERVSGRDSTSLILSWNDPRRNLEAFSGKSVFSSVEDEEEFLYGEEDGRKKPQAVTVPLAQNPIVPQEPKVQAVTSRRPLTPEVSAEECDRVKNLLKTIGLNLSQADISKMAARLKEKQEEQREANNSATLRATMETLLNRSKVQKSDDSRSNRSESSYSHRESEHREQSEKKEKEKERRDKQIQKKRKEYLVKELEGLLKHEGSGDLIPVIGFFCQRCEEFFGDLRSAEGHQHTNTHQKNISHVSSVSQDQQLKDDKSPREQDERNAERKRPREDSRSTEDKPRVQRKKVEDDDAQSSKTSSKKKKKKEKKKKKKEKKKEKKVKVKSEKS